MKIYFIRHGHPDYKNDCLTELGHRQAAAAAEKLKDSGIGQIFSSTIRAILNWTTMTRPKNSIWCRQARR